MMGLAEAFATVSSFEFAYYTAPRSAQTLFMSLHFASIGLSSFVGDIYVDIYTRHAIELDFDVSERIETVVRNICFQIFLVQKQQREYWPLFLYHCCSSICLHDYFYDRSKNIVNRSIE